MNDLIVHPVGEEQNAVLVPVSEAVAVDTFGAGFMWNGIRRRR